MIKNVILAMELWWNPIQKIFYLVGFGFVVTGLATMPGNSRQQMYMQGGPGRSLLMILCGIILLNLPLLMDAASWTIFGQTSLQELSYAGSTDDQYGIYKKFAVYLVMLIGLGGIGAGVIKLRQLADNPYVLGKSATYIIGGIIAINITTFAEAIGVTIGGNVEAIISAFLN